MVKVKPGSRGREHNHYERREDIDAKMVARPSYGTDRKVATMGHFEDVDTKDAPAIQNYYKGKTLFITGVTGFMGHVLLEKLLRSCSELERVYVLLRPKRGAGPVERLNKMFSNILFDQLKAEKPGILESKVVALIGDVGNVSLGLSNEDWELLVSEVNIIFHAAASVRFDDSLKKAVRLNLRSAAEIVRLAKETKNLEALVHVSTAFVNVKYGEELDEILYPPYADWRETMQVAEEVDEDTMNIFTKKYTCGLPNTYVFTKQLAEHVISEERGKLPVVIIRPTLVSSIMDDPVPGWHNTINGMAGIFIGCGTGVLTTVDAKNVRQDYIPVDTCAKIFIATAWYRGIRKLKPTDDVDIYHCSSSDAAYITIKSMFDNGLKVLQKYPMGMPMRYPRLALSTGWTHFVRVLIQQFLFALIVDSCLWVAGRKPFLTKIHRKVHKIDIALAYFSSQNWTFLNKNLVSVRSRIKEEDRKEFYYDYEGVSGLPYMEILGLGGRRYLMNLPDEQLPRDRVVFTIHKVLYYIFFTLLYCYVAWKIMNMIYKLI